MTIKDLAEDPRVSASRTAVSMAINRGLNKGVLARIRSVLDL